ncbi:MAG: 3-thiaglutamate biosynthesis pearlin carrier peptide TglA [Scandinavium sp.]
MTPEVPEENQPVQAAEEQADTLFEEFDLDDIEVIESKVFA